MRIVIVATLAAATSLAAAQTPTINEFTAADVANGQAFHNISRFAEATMKSNVGSRKDAKCTYENAQVRREWRTLDKATRKSFTDAVLCLQKMKPQRMSQQEAASYPGIKSRYDEYVATHINYTMNIHDTADFLAWHRGFAHFFEQDLKTSCGYTGTLPYWDWMLDAEAPQDSPLFSGDEYSMSGNGKFIAGRQDTWLAQQDITFPPGLGGGCVDRGPFSQVTVNLGPLDRPNANNVNSSFQYNPHCLQRDINPWFSQRYTTYSNVTRLILEQTHIEDFQWIMQGYNSDSDKFGVHGGGHWQIGGSMMDFHSSPADALFYLHHAMVD